MRGTASRRLPAQAFDDKRFVRVEPREHGVVLHCESHKTFRTDVPPWANRCSVMTGHVRLEEPGIHCFGEDAGKIAHIGQAILRQPGSANTLPYFVETTFNHPTMARFYRVAAWNSMNRLF